MRPEMCTNCGTKPRKSKGRCKQCYLHFWRYGTDKRTGHLTGLDHPNWAGDAIGYRGAHHRLDRARGRATTHTCTCGSPAQEWALRRDAAGPLLEQGRLRYSANPADYLALCSPCHHEYDEHNAVVRAVWITKRESA